MVQSVEFDLKQAVLVNGPFGPAEVRQMEAAIARDHADYAVLRDAVAELQAKEEQRPPAWSAWAVPVPAGPLLSGHRDAQAGRRRRHGPLLPGPVLLRPATIRPGRRELPGGRAGRLRRRRVCPGPGGGPPLRRQGRRALAVLDGLSGAIEQTAEYLAQRAATVAALGGNPSEVVALYERAVEVDHNHPGALFGLAVENDRRGNDEWPWTSTSGRPAASPPSSAPLMNLGLMYEDREQYDRAAQCYQRVLDDYPDHARAALFFKDTEASHEQFYDEDAAEETRPHGPDPQHPRDRLRAFRPQPQLPAKDGHQHPRRPLPLDRGRAAGQQELRRNQPGRNQGNAGLEGAAAGATGRRAPGGRSLRAGNALAPTSRPCWPSRSPS